MDNNEKQFENFLSDIKFDDKPNQAHLDELEKKLRNSLSNQSRQKNIAKWKLNSRILKFAAAAMIFFAMLVGIKSFNGTTAWAKVLEAFNDVQTVHISTTIINLDGTKSQEQYYLKRPNGLYEETQERIIIDNGKERLILNKKENTAQFSDSLLSYEPLEKHSKFETLGLFRNNNKEGFKITKLDDQSDETTLVFSLQYKDESANIAFKGKAHIDAKTMLPLNIQVELTSEPQQGSPLGGEIICNYGAISDNVFTMVIPADYKELPRKQTGLITGKVLDENNNSVADAIVCIADKSLSFTRITRTDKNGIFSFTVPPQGTSKIVWPPVILRAFKEDDPNHVAWTIIADPNKLSPQSMPVPSEAEHMKIEVGLLKEASGIVLQMEPAGKIFGVVTDYDNKPIQNALVEVYAYPTDRWGNQDNTLFTLSLAGQGEKGNVQARTDTNGRYEFTNLPRFWDKTHFILEIEAAGYVTYQTEFKTNGELNSEHVDLKLYKAGFSVSGVLVDNYGQTLAERMIYPTVNGEVFRYSKTKTDDKGRFRLEGCPETSDLMIMAELRARHPESKIKSTEYVYYPDVSTGIDFQQSKTKYEVKLIAKKPEITLHVEVKNTAGEIMKYFPVEVQAGADELSTEWQEKAKFIQRTDEIGQCTFTNVPDVKGLKIILGNRYTKSGEQLREDAKEIVQTYREIRYHSEEFIELIEGQKEYQINAIALTLDEYRNR
jgi:outer membrane lipoprotein-sorting protein